MPPDRYWWSDTIDTEDPRRGDSWSTWWRTSSRSAAAIGPGNRLRSLEVTRRVCELRSFVYFMMLGVTGGDTGQTS